MKLLVTGGAGFIGSNFIRQWLQDHPDDQIVNLDALTYAGCQESLKDLDHRHHLMVGDVRDAQQVDHWVQETDGVIHFAAESMVDRSITGPEIFVDTNVRGTQVLLEACRRHDKRFLHVSTDEVYGSLGENGLFHETTPLAPNSPYSASKAAADLLIRSYHHTFGLDVLVTRCSNNYGPYQFPEKLIPLLIIRALDDQPLPIYGDGLYVRDWLHVLDHCRAIAHVWERGRAGEVYNVGGRNEWQNLQIAHAILDYLEKPHTLLTHVKDRPGHDRRYAIDATKLETELGWQPQYTFTTGLPETIRWYQTHEWWWRPLLERAAVAR